MSQIHPVGVSVIMPSYNSALTIDQAVTSVLGQTYGHFEFIIVDDCSEDGSYQLLTKWAQKDKRIRLYRNEINLGLMKTLNVAIQHSTSALLARLDSDDEMMPVRLEKQVQFLITHPEIGAVGSWYFLMGRTPKYDKIYRLPSTPAEIKVALLNENPICHPAVVMRKEAFLKVGGYRDEFINSEDYDLWLRFSKLYELANIPEPLIRYRLSLSGNSIGKRHQQMLFHEIAKASFQEPQLTIQEIKIRIEKKFKIENDSKHLRHFYWELTKTLFVLGWYQHIPKTIFSLLKAFTA